MLWTFTFELLSSTRALLGVEFITGIDNLYKIPVYSLRVGLIFMSFTLSLGLKKKEHS